jgi:glycine/D-amino acid oxidase-like deaminating enzyme
MASEVVIVGGGFGGLYAARRLEPRHVVVPREELHWTDIRLGRVVGADPGRNEVHIHTVDGHEETLGYDELIAAGWRAPASRWSRRRSG